MCVHRCVYMCMMHSCTCTCASVCAHLCMCVWCATLCMVCCVPVCTCVVYVSVCVSLASDHFVLQKFLLFYALHQGISFITLLLCPAPNPPNLILMFPQPPPRVCQFPFFLSSTMTLSYLAFVYVTNSFEHMIGIVKGQIHTHGWREKEA